LPRSTTNVWARDVRIGEHSVRQLLVHEHGDVRVAEAEDGALRVCSPFGSWPARRGSRVGPDEPLTAGLPVVDSGNTPVHWYGRREQWSPEEVLASYDGAIGFTAHGRPSSLRRPQIAALHSIVGYQCSGLTEPGVVIMPTGTGKTETMLAWLVAQRPHRVLVIVPSVALRDQVAGKFETLGILQREGIVLPGALRPCVARLEHRLASAEEAKALVAASNVVIATPMVIQASAPEVREVFYAEFTHLLVDEAHHAPAATWTAVIRAFTGRPVLLFTATPYRRDGRTVPGRVISRFPLREAQVEGYFSSIDFTAVLDLGDDDEALARGALGRLRADRAAGYQHVLLARVDKKTRADEILALYKRLAPELSPRVLYDTQPAKLRRETLEAIRTQSSCIVICVDMLGEGFDLPTLKVGAIHDSHKSLSPMIQLIGRLARTSSPVPIGPASVFVRQDPKQALSPLRFLLREDPDWNQVLSDITERATERADQVSVFEASFDSAPADVPVGLLEPKVSAIAFRTSASDWDPHAARLIYRDSILDDVICVSPQNDVAWLVIETVSGLRWGNVPSLRATDYHLIIMYLDRDRGLLYIHGSDTKLDYDDLARAVLDHEPQPIRGYDTFRVFAGLDRVIPTNIGLLDARDRDKRFSMHVGSDVETALTEAERSHKANTHIATSAIANGDRVTIAAALSGRFWAMKSADGLADWCRWCEEQGAKLRDGSIQVRSLFRDMIIPVDVTERPPHPVLAMEWPWELYSGNTTWRLVRDGVSMHVTDAEFRIDDFSSDGPLQFSVLGPGWEIPYRAEFGPAGIRYELAGTDEVAVRSSKRDAVPLSAWLNAYKPTLFLSGDRMITGDDRLLEPRTDVRPYPRSALRHLDWVAGGVDLKVESQGRERRPDSIQAFMVKHLKQTETFDVLIDDDRSGEAADLVGIKVDKAELLVTLVHCKFSEEPTAGHRLKDLYEVCGQAMRGARWRDNGALPLLDHLDRRVIAYNRNWGGTAFEVGDRAALFSIRQRAPQLFPRITTVIVQPGLSIAEVTDEQLRLMAGAASYVQSVTKGGMLVYCSA
jgi:superfamily II DNA or RNA helicase